MGVKGPIPKRSTEGHRTTQSRKLDGGVEPVNVIAEKVVAPDPDPDWHPIARDLFAGASSPSSFAFSTACGSLSSGGISGSGIIIPA